MLLAAKSPSHSGCHLTLTERQIGHKCQMTLGAGMPKDHPETWYSQKENHPIAWFFQNLFKPLFSHAEVLTLAGERLTHDTLQNWANRKYVKPKMVKGKRRYNAIEVAQIAIAQPLIKQFDVEPSTATLAIVTAALIFQRKMKSKEFSLNQAPHLLAIFTKHHDEPAFVQKPTAKLFETDEAFIVLPFGRLLNDLAKRQRHLVESRRQLLERFEQTQPVKMKRAVG